MTALGIYIFAGGFTLGVKDHFEVLAHFEKGRFGVDTAKRNFPSLPVFTDPKTWPVDSCHGVDFIYGNPPCAAWSTAGAKSGKDYNTHWINDPRIECHRSMFDVVFKLRPRVFTFESVANIVTSGQDFIKECSDLCHEQGYGVTILLTDATNHGLAQRRRRVFFFGHQVRLDFETPTPRWLTVGDVLRHVQPTHVPKLAATQQEILHLVKPGQKIREVFDRVYPDGAPSKPSFMRRRLHPDEPANTIATHSDYFHPYEDRLLTPNEAAAICGYPADYSWPTSESAAYAEVGAAVLPPVAEYVAYNVKASLVKNEPLINPEAHYQTLDFLTQAERYYKETKKQQL